LKKKSSFKKKLLTVIVLGAVFMAAAVWLYWPKANWALGQQGSAKAVAKATASKKEIKNVLLISIDTLRADHLSCYGYSHNTSPNIDAFAKDAVLFNHSISPVSLTLPSHTSMMTGTTPLYHKIHDNDLRLSSENYTLAEMLKEKGFETGAIIGAFVLDSQFGMDQGFDVYDDFLKEREEKSFFFNERSAKDSTKIAKEFLEEKKDSNFFLFLHYFDVHGPYKSHKRFAVPSAKLLYDGEIKYVDHYVGQVLQKLKDMGLYDSTLIIITADHGESLNDHFERTHGYFIYHSTVHVPLIIRAPGGLRNAKVNDTVGLIDIMPTICGALNINIPESVQGRDLGPYLSGEGRINEKRFFYCESLLPTKFNIGPLLGIVSENWKYIHTQQPELYDIAKDPKETENLIEQNDQQVFIMQSELRKVLEDNNIKGIVAAKPVLDKETEKRLQALGYVAGESVDENIQYEQKGLNPKHFIEVHNALEDLLKYSANGKYKKAKKIGNYMLEKWPKVTFTHILLSKTALIEEDEEQLVYHLSKYLEKEENKKGSEGQLRVKQNYTLAFAHTNLGVAIEKRGDTKNALEHFKKALEYDPDYSTAHFNFAGLYYKQNMLDKAIKLYNRTLQTDPEMEEAHRNLGNIYVKQGRYKKALYHYAQVLTANPDQQDIADEIKNINQHKMQIGKTIGTWVESLKDKPNQPKLYDNIAIYFYKQENYEKAVTYWQKALEFSPDWSNVLDKLAMLRATAEDEKYQDHSQAISLAAKACKISDNKNPNFLYTLSIAYAAKGKLDEARVVAQQALKLAQAANNLVLIQNISDQIQMCNIQMKTNAN